MATERYSTYCFSQANPRGAGQDDVPALLRRVARSIEAIDSSVTVHDLVLHLEVTEDGYWPSISVYYSDTN